MHQLHTGHTGQQLLVTKSSRICVQVWHLYIFKKHVCTWRYIYFYILYIVLQVCWFVKMWQSIFVQFYKTFFLIKPFCNTFNSAVSSRSWVLWSVEPWFTEVSDTIKMYYINFISESTEVQLWGGKLWVCVKHFKKCLLT